MFKIPEDLESKYRFVMLAAKRAEQLQAGALPRVETESTKSTVVAQEEIATGAVQEWDPAQEGLEEAEEAGEEE